MKITFAMFSNTLYNYTELSEHNKEEYSKDWVRTSDWITITLPERNPQEILDRHMANLAQKESAIRADMMDSLKKVDQRRKELLALPAPVAGDLLREEIQADAAEHRAAERAERRSSLDDDLAPDYDLPF